MRSQRIGVVGAGPGGSAAALLLTRDGHQVDLFDQPEADRAPGAGIMVQRLGQEVLGRLGLLGALADASAHVLGVDGRTRSGRVVMKFRYADAVPGAHGLGVSRGRLRDVFDVATAAEVGPTTETRITGMEGGPGAWFVRDSAGVRYGPYDLVIGADGSNSALRRGSGLTARNRPFGWGAVWALISDPDGLAGDDLVQRYQSTRVTLGLLPVSRGETVLFWSAPVGDLAALTADPTRWHALASPHARGFEPLIDRAAEGSLMSARYWDVRVKRCDAPGLALIGDAAHATSPQLGSGGSLALTDAWVLASALRRHSRIADATAAYTAERKRHVAYYQFLSRAMTPVFQSRIPALGAVRDVAIPIGARVPWVRRQMVTTLMGVHTGPFSTVRLPD